MRKMKIKTTSAEHNKQVQEALFAEGHSWQPFGRTYNEGAASFLYTGTFGDKFITMDNCPDYFNKHANTEHFLVNGKFVTALPAEPLKDICIKVDSNTAQAVAVALEQAGYRFNLHSITPDHVGAEWLTGNAKGGLIGYSAYGKPSRYEEYVLTHDNKLIAAKDYFKQPSTAYCHGCNALTCPGGGCGDVTEKTYAPLPIQPFSQWTAERMRLLAEHITEALKRGESVAEMAKELSVLAYLNKHFEKEVEQ